MKKFNKFIPIISVIGTSVVAPITISSCHPEYVKPMKMYDLTKEYIPETQPIEDVTQYNQTQATERYIRDVKENPQILIDDACLAAKELINDVDGVLAFDFGVSEPRFGLTTISHYGGEDIEYSTVTCEQRIHYERFEMENNSTKKVLTIDLDVWYKDVVFYAYENGLDENGGWNLGLFDYNVGSEAYWPFISNTNPWSISYSCKAKLSTYYVTADGQETLLNNHCSYYSANVDNGTTLINLLKRYSDPDIDELEKVILGIILIDYKSNYLIKIDNKPEVVLSYVLQSNYSGSLSLELNGLILILPSYMKNKDGLKSINVVSGVTYTISAESSPLGQANSITIPTGPIAPTSLKQITEYRYEVPLVGNLGMLWDVPAGTDVSMYLTCPDAIIDIEVSYYNPHTEQIYHYTEMVNLKYNYTIHSIVSNN